METASGNDDSPDGLYQRRVGRKIFLGLLGVGAAGLASGSLLSPVVSRVRNAALPASGFTIYTVAPMPVFNPHTWRLTVEGLVDHRLTLSYADLLSLPGQAFQPDVMLGYHLNRRPLVREQGAPLRLVVPEMYGYKYAKWINRVEFSDRQEIGYWEHNGYTVDAYLGTE